MSNFKFHEAPDFWLRKKLEAMDNDEFPPFRTFPNTRGDCEYQENFISTNIDEKKLIEDLSSSYFKRNKFDANRYVKDKRNFKSSKVRDFNNREIVKDGIRSIQKRDKLLKTPFTKEQLEREIEKFNYKNLASSLLLNTTKCYLNNSTQKNSFEVNIDIDNKSVTYTYYIYFEDLDKKNHSRSAITLRTSDAELLLFFLEKVYGEYEASKIRKVIWKKFLYQLNEKDAIKELMFLYDKLPSYIRLGYHTEVEKDTKPYKIFDTTLWKHFKMFADYDKGTSDASYYVVYVMSLITPKYCMERFMEDQKLVLQVYENLDDQGDIEAFFGWYNFSKTFPGFSSFEPTNRDVFATMLNSYIQLFEGNAKLCVFESSGAHFHQGIHDVRPQAKEEWKHTVTYTLNAGIEDGKIHLENSWESEEKIGYTLLPSNRFSKSRSVVDVEFSNGFNEIGSYNPLDVIKFTQYNDKGEAVTMNVPAIFIRHVSYIKKWERISKVIRFGFNILMVVGSAATIYSGASSMMLYAAITDMGLATGDIFVQGKELKKSDYVGQEAQNFLRLWNEIYNTLGLVTFSPIAIKVVATNAPKIVHSGANILQGTGRVFLKKEAYKKVKELTLKAIHNLEIPNFNKTGLQIIAVGEKLAGLKNISKLQKVGAVFCRNIHGDITVIYKSIPIAIGKAKEISLQLHEALKLGKQELLSYLQELTDVCRLVLKNKKFLDIIRYVINHREFKGFLSIHQEAIITYYTASGFDKLNKALRGIILLRKEYISFERLLNKALDKLPNSIYNGAEYTLYRSVEMSEELIKKLFLGKKVYTEEGFFSTSFHRKKFLENWFQYKPNHNVIFKVQGKNGKLVEVISDIVDEAEVLFKSKTEFEILSINPAPHPFDPTLEIYEIILIEL
ncbi:ADP-ribosyltransferase [Kordia sp.]|uniref:ADP-ribosyltransferase n=1 Tax=Kordia sp. TaxID=1965332 RepID=UPI003D6B80CA